MNAFFYIDKPSWCTSFDVLRDMRRKLNFKKFWHTGTLDPLASGGLLVARWNYTKLLSYLHADTKTYIADIMLDGTSPSLDRDTEITFLNQSIQIEAQKNISQEDIKKLLSECFFWEIEQIPPSYSALKIDGKKALDRVLEGEEIELRSRKATIYESQILEYNYPLLRAQFRVSAGTYIRSIARDIGEKLWLWGYISELRRTRVGNLDISLATTLDELTEEKTLSEKLLFWDAYIEFSDEEIYTRLSNGQRVRSEQSWQSDTPLFLTDSSGIRFVVEYRDGVIHPRRKV